MPTFTFDDTTEALPVLMLKLLEDGDEVGSRNGRVKELVNTKIVLLEPWKREILTPHRRASLPAQIAETMWLLAGRDDVEWLTRYLPRAPDFSDDGKVWRGAYGPRIRRWYHADDHGQVTIDQLAYVVDLLQKNPLDRRAVINIYDPAIDSQPGKDIPCNDWIHFLSRGGRLHMFVTVRSNDAMWGWSGINAFEWSILQEIVAAMLGIGVGPLTFNVSSFHLYDRHWEKARKIAECRQSYIEPVSSNRFYASGFEYDDLPDVADLDDLIRQWFQIEELLRQPSDVVTPARQAVDNFPEPMLRSWLRVIAWHWSSEEKWLEPLKGTRLFVAAMESPQNKVHDLLIEHGVPEKKSVEMTSWQERHAAIDDIQQEFQPIQPTFVEYVAGLHAEKHKAYGDSWKRRGEMLGIMANIARKIDRLGQNTSDETSADTAIDLLVYLVKYRWWLTEFNGALAPVENTAGWTKPTDYAEPVELLLKQISPEHPSMSTADIEHLLTWRFSRLETYVKTGTFKRHYMVDSMIWYAFTLAERLWETRSKPLEPVVEGDDYLGADHE